MTKITKELLLRKGNPQCATLGEVKKINLSKLQLKTEDLDPGLFSQMKKLEELDLSENLLTEIPNNISLPNLRVLNCAANQLEDVTSLQQFQKLEELSFEDNLYMTISDNYKMMFLLQNLHRLNGKDVTSTANHVRFVNSRELASRVTAYWQKNYKSKAESPETVKAVEKEFVKSAVKQVKYGPNSLSDFTKWRVKMIATEFIASLLKPEKKISLDVEGEEDDRNSAISEGSDSVKKKDRSQLEKSSSLVTCGSKKNKDTACITLDESPRKKKRLQSSYSFTSMGVNPCNPPQVPNIATHVLLQDCNLVPRLKSEHLQCKKSTGSSTSELKKAPAKETSASSPKVSMRIKAMKGRDGKEAQPREALRNGKDQPNKLTADAEKSKQGVTLQPLHFLQCHSKENNPEDFKTALWSCAFEPFLSHNPDKNCGSTSSQTAPATVATCGGDSVCLIDCETGKVLKKYKITGEELFSLAWTTLTMITSEGQKRKFNVLAVAGRKGIVKLIHTRANICYGEIKAHKKPISTICFSPKQETFLFTGSYDEKIILWDIGVPDCDYTFRVRQLLVLEAGSTTLRIVPVPINPDWYLLTACEDGCYAWDINLNKQQGKRSFDLEFQFPVFQKENEETDFHIVDGLCFLNDDVVASKSCLQGSIYLWSWSKTLESRRKKQSKKVNAVILAELEWARTDVPYIQIACSSDMNCILCGDNTGAVWIYDVGNLEDAVSSGKLITPTKILKWPTPKVKGQGDVSGAVINNLCVDSKFIYLVTLTDKNIVIIWK
ncbi:leucine-rich repeat and WD repeat-containing protein 1 [Protopterus annectens]|uniref:leucine-rich repeat and WD repeat-containing protein 1 n=1 Tax=Protopterus annectens TaxID=7888 RepID=UPI001CFA5EAE|nr:leucine-rich repeat and WD repeat-containing protein 1 [Protopterus annectens]